MAFLVFLAIGFGMIWLSRKTKEDVPVIATAAGGAIALIWGFAIAPLPFQMAIEILGVLAIFLSCMGYCDCPSSNSP
jgi:amino acid transporter